MLESYFTSLTKRQTMLLLTAVTFGGQESAAAFEFLPEGEAELLTRRAQALLQIPKDQRIPLLVAEMKRLVASNKGSLWTVDPVKLCEILQAERPALVDVLLRALPENLATAFRVFLPETGVRARKDIRPEVLNAVRWKLDEILKRHAPRSTVFRFSDVRLLQGRELLTLCEWLGARALGATLAGLAAEQREAFVAQLPPELRAHTQESIRAGEPRKLLMADAGELLALHQEGGSPLDALRSAGAQRLVRAAMAQSPDFAGTLIDRHRAELPSCFVRWFKEERSRTIVRGDGGRTEVVLELELLAERGWVEPPLRMPHAPKPPLPNPLKRSLGPKVAEPVPLLIPRPRSASREEAEAGKKRDPIADRRARLAGAMPAGREGAARAPRPPRAPPEAGEPSGPTHPHPPKRAPPRGSRPGPGRGGRGRAR